MMRFLFLATVCYFSFLVSCKEAEKPHLSREKMLGIVTDLHLAEVYSTMKNEDKSANKNMDSLAYYYKSILSHHKVTMEELKSSIKWYSENPKELDSVYINTLTEISTIEGVINASANNNLPQ